MESLAVKFAELRTVRLTSLKVGAWFASAEGDVGFVCNLPADEKRPGAFAHIWLSGDYEFRQSLVKDDSETTVLPIAPASLRVVPGPLSAMWKKRETKPGALAATPQGAIVAIEDRSDGFRGFAYYRLKDGMHVGHNELNIVDTLWTNAWEVQSFDLTERFAASVLKVNLARTVQPTS